MPLQPVVIRSQPGIKRDGTKFEGNFYVDGQWCRFQRGLPRKMGGYRALQDRLDGIARGMHIHNHSGFVYVHIGTKDGVFRFRLNQNGLSSIVTNRTDPAYVSNANANWVFDVAFNTTTNQNEILAHVAYDIEDISSDANGALYRGFDNGTAPLSLESDVTVSGGIVALAPYVFAYGSDGFVQWSRAGYTDDWTGGDAGNARVTSQKIVKGLPLRAGAGNAPSGLFWSLDSVVRASYVGGAAVFNFDTITSQSSILSGKSVIEYDGLYFWCGVDRFLMFNGVVREVPNQLNLNWFYDNLNYAQRQKVFAFKVPRWGEIWWCYPRGSATECTHAVIYNVREETWYDTVLPNSGRSAGQYAQVFNSPLVIGVIDTETTQFRGVQNTELRITEDGNPRIINDPKGYVVWQHEYGTDEINGDQIRPVQSFFETADMSLLSGEQPQNMALRVEYIEPDFVQVGNMTVQITGRANAKSAEVTGDPQIIYATPTERQQQLVYFREIRREMRFRFESNTLGGSYQMGQVIAHVEPATGTVLGGNPGAF
jgi:hypothetical protein